MKQETKTIYRCDFCQKKYFVKPACERHEKMCSKNPANHRPCLQGCKHLENVETQYEASTGESYERVKAKGFYCAFYYIELYHPRLAHKIGAESIEEDKNPMPLTCEQYVQDDKF